MRQEVDYLVIGSGLAGLTFALNAAQHGHVLVLTKKSRSDANSSWAQGGIAGVLSDEDSFELHKQDTLVAGAGLCNEEAVDILVHEGPERIRDLMALGAGFNTEFDESGRTVLALGREGGHSRNRIVHTADFTGWECERTLLDAVRGRSDITLLEHLFVTDLLLAEDGGCAGARAVDAQGASTEFIARSTLLATGGCGHVYRHTTNPIVATGDGVAMAWRAGASISNMEFIQFHPTTLYHPDARAFLITEALRGEGGLLVHADGERFMPGYHALAELAPRDVVARAIVAEMKRRNVPCVYLDATGIDSERLKAHFPTIYERCLAVNIDITRQPIPVAPAQHYQCGGVTTDLDGATTLARLYAAGEVACTGVHGANRLASNSLLEALVFGQRAAMRARQLHGAAPYAAAASTPSWFAADGGQGQPNTAEVKARVQRIMNQHAGIVRSIAELDDALYDVENLLVQLRERPPQSVEDWEAVNIAQVAWLILQSARRRHESRGLHYVLDYPERVESERQDTVLTP